MFFPGMFNNQGMLSKAAAASRQMMGGMAPPAGGMATPGPPSMQGGSTNQPIMSYPQPGGQHGGTPFQGTIPGQHPGPGGMQGQQQQASFSMQPGLASQAMHHQQHQQQQDQIQVLQQVAMQQGVMHSSLQQGGMQQQASLQQGAIHPSFQQQGTMQAIQQNVMHQGTMHPSLQQQQSPMQVQGNMQGMQQGGLPQDPAILGGMASQHMLSPSVAAAYMEQQQASHSQFPNIGAHGRSIT